ncbi:tRNA-dihydrouridine synthase [Pseudoroseicyclus aestuarii]|uniref:2,4-dienoyl-CoA reductase-like NADH-dependent reductase (Old Yellow Enzyme family) n=1 Tax=Pseudoroseicyclus aestuarii TaxID=1795041 RepID=A0A318SQ03_9RHOB|nr:tRNA-dihydrouridine synthase [Pseudoroseicyclus aestuarii]PYE83950.1 2,4-dienoyl-CoA reductase-like NADH-dependent reductase (Old Yellow Enzyme family) [Pseudoroseicyclus aestuarii]
MPLSLYAASASAGEDRNPLFTPLRLPCGAVLRNRIMKSAMSDRLADGSGHPTDAQAALYRKWSQGGAAVSIIGEVQGDARFPEAAGNLVLDGESDLNRFARLAREGMRGGGQLWLQLGHAGALTDPAIGTPKGPSALDLPELSSVALKADEIAALPALFARTARLAQVAGFGGVQLHAAHGFLLSQFLSPLFNRREDAYGGSIEARMQIVLEIVDAVRAAVGPAFPIAIKINATDRLDGGLTETDALKFVAALEQSSIDLIEISGGTYFPGAPATSEHRGSGAYFASFARSARSMTAKPLLLTGGIKTMDQAEKIISEGTADGVGLARAFAIIPEVTNLWRRGEATAPAFPRFTSPPEGGVTAWYTMRLAEIAEDMDHLSGNNLDQAVVTYTDREQRKADTWRSHFDYV